MLISVSSGLILNTVCKYRQNLKFHFKIEIIEKINERETEKKNVGSYERERDISYI